MTVDASKLSSLALPLFNIAGLPQYDPAETVLEVARESDGWTLAAGVTWKQLEPVPRSLRADDRVPAGPRPATCSHPRSIAFSDTLRPARRRREVLDLPRHASVKLRGGFLYEPTPVPSPLPSSLAYGTTSHTDGPVPTRFFDASRYVVSLGGGVDFGDITPFSVDMYVQYHGLLDTTVVTPPAPSATLSGSVLAYGVLLGTQF